MKSTVTLIAVAITALLLSTATPAESRDFYQDKTVKFMVGYNPGGAFDLYTRLIARHIGKYIPGSPRIIVQNMPGAAGLILANHVYNRADPDGLTIGAFSSVLVLQHLLGNPAAAFDGRNFGWVGVPTLFDMVCLFNRESRIQTIQDWLTAKTVPHLSAQGPGVASSDIPRLLEAALGLPMNLVEGYKGGSVARRAVIDGEADGYCASWQVTRMIWQSELEAGLVRVVTQASLRPNPELKGVPLAIDYAQTDEARLLLQVGDSIYGYIFTYAVPPGTPKDRLAILQKAFMQALRDPNLVADARKADLDINPTDGLTLSKMIARLYGLNASTVTKLKSILIPKR